MSNGKIDYSLGLETSGLLGKLTGVNQAFDLMGKVIDGVGAVSRTMFSQFENGGRLNDLSARTGETVKNLYSLEYAFKQSGVASGNVSPLLLRFQKSLSGVGEMGENTAEAFAALKLNIGELRGMDLTAALQKVFAGLNGLDRNSATDVASRIFGRGSSGDILQLARDADSFAQSLQEVAAIAQRMQNFAGVFDSIGDQIGRIGLQFEGGLLSMAASIAPAINGMLTTLANGDFARFAEIMELSLTVAFENSVNFLVDALARVAAAMPQLLAGVQNFGAGALGGPLAKGFAAIMWDMRQTEADLAQDKALKAQRQDQADYWFGVMQATEDMGLDFANEGAKNFRQAFQDGMAASGPRIFGSENQQRLQELVAGFGPVIGGGPRKPGVSLGVTNLLSSFSGGGFGDANALERVGASFGAGSDFGNVQRKQLAVQQRIYDAHLLLIKEVKEMDRKFDPLNM